MEAVLPSIAARSSPGRLSFIAKLLGAATLVALADLFFYRPHQVGATLGLFALALIASLTFFRPELRRRKNALSCIGAAAAFALIMVEDPGLLSVALCWAALSLAVLLPRSVDFGSGAAWLLRVALHTLAAPLAPIRDARTMAVSRRRGRFIGVKGGITTLVLPGLGSLVFLILFAAANPLIEDAIGSLDPVDDLSVPRLGLWLFILILVWRLLRPRLFLRRVVKVGGGPALRLAGVTSASVTLSLVAFNAVFAVQNVLDLAFLWSGAPLPDGMTLAYYAHRGAYPLIATALLAGLFVLATLRPGSEMAASPPIRFLVSLWIAQNVLLVASSMLRTVDYIEVYSLTELKIHALIWMVLVAVGLLLICARLWLGKSDVWLINANLVAAALVLAVSAPIDYDRIAAGWNVRHAREVGGRGAGLDLCYLHQMGASALLPLVELESRRLPQHLRLRVAWLRNDIMDRLEARQAVWQSWTWRGARRLDAAHRTVAARRLPRFKAAPRQCDGSPYPRTPVATNAPPPIQVTPPPPPLTARRER